MSSHDFSYLQPDWPAPASVRAYVSTRIGGVSERPFTSLNLGAHVGDVAEHVAENRRLFAQVIGMPGSVQWLNQVHGTNVVSLPCHEVPSGADAAVSDQLNQVCTVLTADCLPVFFCDEAGTKVAVAHAGWRGLCAGVLEEVLKGFDEAEKVLVWLGPAIGPEAFEVGDEVREAFIAQQPEAQQAFVATENGKWLGNLYLLARQRLMAKGVERISGGEHCTFTDKARFYSYRRDGQTGRMASVIWLAEG
ncbi:peptidoglycan editing factor PgeF [Marinomonas sp. M1K-6]|uniref:Purine nucleoside phosphorylase n=1 Tax=Marinomonas profundi TaxID=2726122 RepID=A0A847RFU5_9GAMM|nr:peptidoglycan editing factor PgeF [Marinomonas profundi]NLQ19140.1 peptidoglycan editing factor PgeF [Marinomonas profundi]UDV02053.1 peptidoglycan editing factor PgeF [Marinomonas profundi]